MEIFESALKEFTANNSEDLTVFSPIPDKCKVGFCYVGIDEAGRGPVLGPMVYGIFCSLVDKKALDSQIEAGNTLAKIEENPPCLIDSIPKMNDSKQLNEKTREEIFKQIADLDYIAFGLKFISPSQISSKSFRRQKISLNDISHDAAIELTKGLIDRGVKIAKVFVDTVGPMDKYQKKLEGIFPELQFKVDKKADSKYKTVSAASVCAKVARDHALKDWQYPDNAKIVLEKSGWGSGYPADPVTKAFLRKNIDPVFGFPNIVRNSWSTAQELLKSNAVKIKWESNSADESTAPKIFKYFGKAAKGTEGEGKLQVSTLKSQFFTYRNLEQTTFI